MEKKKAAVPVPSLMDLELEVEVEGREWMRKRLEERLQEVAAQHGEIPPPQRKPAGASAVASRAAAQRGRKR